MSDELKKLLEQLDALAVNRANQKHYTKEIEEMRELLFEAATVLAPVKLQTLRHLASFKLQNDGVVDAYVVTGKQIRDLFAKYEKSTLLPKVQKTRN